MELLQSTAIDSQTYLIISKQNKTKQYWHTYNKKRQEYLLKKQKERRLKLKSRTTKLSSVFQQTKTQQFLKLLINQKSFVPVPQKLKHPIIKKWNADNYWYSKKLKNFNNLERGCVRIMKDNWNNSTIIWLDIDQPKWTKLAKQLRCGYVTSPKKHIRIPVPIKDLQGKKTGALYYQGEKIGDAKLTGEVMLPSQAYYDKEGKFLGYYEYKAWGTFFPLNNRIWENTEEFFTFLKQISGIEYKSISQHFFLKKFKENHWEQSIYELNLFKSVREPPGQKLRIKQNNSSRIAHYR